MSGGLGLVPAAHTHFCIDHDRAASIRVPTRSLPVRTVSYIRRGALGAVSTRPRPCVTRPWASRASAGEECLRACASGRACVWRHFVCGSAGSRQKVCVCVRQRCVRVRRATTDDAMHRQIMLIDAL